MIWDRKVDKPEDGMNWSTECDKRLKEVESRLAEVEGVLSRETATEATLFHGPVSPQVTRFLFLESRLAAVESWQRERTLTVGIDLRNPTGISNAPAPSAPNKDTPGDKCQKCIDSAAAYLHPGHGVAKCRVCEGTYFMTSYRADWPWDLCWTCFCLEQKKGSTPSAPDVPRDISRKESKGYMQGCPHTGDPCPKCSKKDDVPRLKPNYGPYNFCPECGFVSMRGEIASGDPCPKCAEKKPVNESPMFMMGDIVGPIPKADWEHVKWLYATDRAAFDVYWANKQAKKGGE